MDAEPGREELRRQFERAREREANGALLIVQLSGTAVSSDTAMDSLEAVRGAVHDRPGVEVYRLDELLIACLLPDGSAAEARAAAGEINKRLAPYSASIGIANFYEFFTADGTASDIVREIERTARSRLETSARRGPGAVCDTSDSVTPREEHRSSVFVIEPDPVSVELLTAALDAAGFEVLSFQNGEAAMASIEASPPSLIICEAMTPRLNGFVIRERLRASPQLEVIPFILVSHSKTEDMIRRAAEADIRHFFRKPLSIVEIVGLAANLTRSHSP